MPWRPHGHAHVNPDSPRAWATCDRCGFNFNHYMLQWQYQWGGFQLINQRILVCDTCLDKPAAFLRALVLPPDPPPLFNVRPENYAMDETDFRVTEEDDQRITETGDDRVTESSADEDL
jgi:hypothetical protein